MQRAPARRTVHLLRADVVKLHASRWVPRALPKVVGGLGVQAEGDISFLQCHVKRNLDAVK